MAKKPTFISSALARFTGSYSEQQLKSLTKGVYNPQSTLYSTAERDKLLSIAAQTPPTKIGTQVDPLNYFGDISRRSIHDTLDNERIIQMAPEVSLAASIMIPCIMSPNDMRDGVVQITCNDTQLSDKQKTEIGKLLTDFFEDNYHLSTLIPRWIEEAMYRSGAQPILVMPLDTLYSELTDPSHVMSQVSTESATFVKARDKIHRTNVFGFGDPQTEAEEAGHNIAGLEKFTQTIINTSGLVADPRNKRSARSGSSATDKSTAISQLAKSICSTENLAVVDNPNTITLPEVKNRSARDALKQKVAMRYKDAEVDALPTPTDKNKLVDHPMFMQIPAEAIIPIYTPGTPSDHIGYFMIIDEFGHPIDAVQTGNLDSFGFQGGGNGGGANYRNQEFSTLFQAYGFTKNEMYDSVPERQVMEGIYQQVIEEHLRMRASGAGFSGVSLGQNNSFYRCMFTRYLQQRKTKLMFIPREYLTYFCFKYSNYGTGVSKLEELKWILSLRISLITARMISAFNNSIDRKELNITFPNDYVGNVEAHMRTALREAVAKDMFSFSHNPSDTAAYIAEKSYSIKASNIPGLENYSITKDIAAKPASALPDPELSADIRNMEYLGLEVPPSLLNNLNDAEFSRSVATTNIVFARKLRVYQGIVCRHATEFVQNFTWFSQNLRQAISKIVAVNTPTVEDAGTIVENQGKKQSRRINEIIRSIKVTLPSPNMAPNDAQFDTLTKALTSIGTLADMLLPDIGGSDQKTNEAISLIKSVFKSRMAQRQIQNSGLSSEDFPDILSDFDAGDVLKLRHAFINLSKGLDLQDTALGGQADSSGGGFSSDMGSAPSSFAPDSGADDGVDDFSNSDGLTSENPDDDQATALPDDATSEASPEEGTPPAESTAEGGATGDEPDGKSII